MLYIILNIILILWIFGKLLYFNFDNKINTPPFRWKIHKKSVQAMIATGLVISGLISCFGFDMLWVVFGILLNALLFADVLYMRYYKNPLTLSVIIHQAKLLKGISHSVYGVFLIKDLVYLIDLPIIVILTMLLSKNPLSASNRMILSVVSMITGVVWFWYIYKHSNTRNYLWNKKRIARDLGIIYYHINDLISYIKDRIKKNQKLTPDELEEIKAACWKKTSNPYSGLAKDKNLIVVQMESMQEFLRDRVIEGQEITPNLNKLSQECIRFDHMFFQTSVGNTSDAELVFNNSLYPLIDKPVCYECQNNTFRSIGQAMKKKGYQNFAAHGNMASFWNRHLIYRLYGYDSFTDNSMLDEDEFIFPGLSDSSFFRQMTNFLSEKSKLGKFYSFLITLSLHHPYDYFEKDDFQVGKLEGTFLGRYIKGAHYADKAIDEFIQDLKDKGLYDDTLLLMYGDHSGVPRQFRQELVDYLEIEDTDFNIMQQQKVVALMRIPGQKEGLRIKKTVGQIDLLPTVANLMDLDLGYALGNDIFDDSYLGGIITREGTVVMDEFMYFTNKGQAYDRKTGEPMELNDTMKLEIKRLQNKMAISDLILERNAFRE